jgi:hypothetical protein
MVSSPPPTSFLSLTSDWHRTFVVDPVLDIGNVMLREVLRSVAALQAVMTEEQRADGELIGNLSEEFLCLYLHVLNRTAFRFGHEFRCKLQDKMVDQCFPYFIQSLYAYYEVADRGQLCEKLLSRTNETEILYGQKRTIADKDLSAEAVLTAFAKRVSLLLGHPIAYLKCWPRKRAP